MVTTRTRHAEWFKEQFVNEQSPQPLHPWRWGYFLCQTTCTLSLFWHNLHNYMIYTIPLAGGPLETIPTLFLDGFLAICFRMICAPGKSALARLLLPW